MPPKINPSGRSKRADLTSVSVSLSYNFSFKGYTVNVILMDRKADFIFLSFFLFRLQLSDSSITETQWQDVFAPLFPVCQTKFKICQILPTVCLLWHEVVLNTRVYHFGPKYLAQLRELSVTTERFHASSALFQLCIQQLSEDYLRKRWTWQRLWILFWIWQIAKTQWHSFSHGSHRIPESLKHSRTQLGLLK